MHPKAKKARTINGYRLREQFGNKRLVIDPMSTVFLQNTARITTGETLIDSYRRRLVVAMDGPFYSPGVYDHP